jgi:hypothetical protein
VTTPATSGTDIDHLVPAPWGPLRRSTVALLVAGGLAVLGVLWWTGVTAVNLAPVRGYSYDAVDDTVDTTEEGARRGVVELRIAVTNRGLLPVEDLVVDSFPFGRAELIQPGGPIDIPARSTRDVTLHLAIDDCSGFQAAPWPGLHVFARSGPFGRAQGNGLRIVGEERSATTPTWPDAREPDGTSWWYEIALPVCDPDALHAP